MTLAVKRRRSVLQPQLLRRRQPLNSGELRVRQWLREAGLRPEHERWFYEFWTDADGIEHGFRLDFRFRFGGNIMGLEVCEAGRYSEPPLRSDGMPDPNWKSPDLKLFDKRSKIKRLHDKFGVPCALVTEVEIDLWASLSPGDRRVAVRTHLQGAIANLAAAA
jgi:hypothetical protein